MRAPAFWRRDKSFAAWALGPIGARVGALTAARMGEPGERVAVPVICIGNLTAGGAGKTPTAICMAHALAARGERPFLLSRGYGGRLEGPVRVDQHTHAAAEVGDEPLLLSRAAPTIVARDRPAGARLAATQGASVILLDDGFQNPSLTKDFVLVVVDGAAGVGNGRCLPAGPLRAPLDGQLMWVDAVLVIGPGAAGAAIAQRATRAGKPVFRGTLVPDPAVAAALAGRRVLAVAGLGRPEKLVETLQALGAEVVALRALADHASPTERQAQSILDAAARLQAVVVTTEKDVVKWRGERTALARAAIALPVTLALSEHERLMRLIAEALVDPTKT